MQRTLYTGLALAAALMLAMPKAGWARHKHLHAPVVHAAPDSTDQSPAAPAWGVGFGYLPGPGGASNALSGTYRFNPDLSLDGLLLGGIASTINTGTDSAGNPVNGSNASFGLGAQARYSLLHPTDYLAFQLVGRLSYVTMSGTTPERGFNVSSSSGQFGVFLGAGFEGFLPAWRVVSVEVNSGVNIALTGVSGASAGGSSMSLGASNANAFVPFNLAVHYYFD